ncbi:TDP43-N domain-containing protein [Aphelenchoides bicaudatus]|nr:TDP43-N domain-containing protein [Aphelenchoides bicaudatus]
MPVNLRVEPCQLEVSDDQNLPLATLQTIYPGAIGLTYRLDDGSKCSVPFDGKAFTAPKGGWASAADFYSVSLGGCVNGGQNSFFESYQNACKQLERTVQTIHRLMSQSSNDDAILDVYREEKLSPKLFMQNGKSNNIRERHGSFRSQVAMLKSSHESNNNRLDLWLPHKNSDELEQQFAELSSILVGKNAIIESQRKQLQTERIAEEELEKKNEKLKSEIDEWKQKYQALNEELRLMQEMSSKQEFMGNRVKMLNSELETLRNTNNQKIEEMQTSLVTVQDDLKNLNERHENLQVEYEQLVVEVNEKTSKINELRQRTNHLELELNDHKKQYAEQSKCSHDLEERLCRENIGLAEWSKKLELENKQQQVSLDNLQVETKQKLSTMNSEFKSKVDQLQDDYEQKCKETADLHNLIESLNKHLTQISHKYSELDDAYKTLRKTSESLYFKEHRRANSPLM